jgi:DNA-binding NarL/FixJ family response regulator
MHAMSKQPITVLIADDHPLIIDGLARHIESQANLRLLGTATNGHSAWEEYLRLNPEIVLLDIEMPGDNGIDLTVRIKQHNPTTKVILLTMHTQPWIIAHACKAKPDGILIKNSHPSEIVQAIKSVMHGNIFYSPEVELLIRRNNKTIDNLLTLTQREREVLKLLSNGDTTKMIAEKLFLSENTVETYRRNLLFKLETPNVACLIKKASELGLI